MVSPFPLQKGVKQGDPVSPILFNAVLESVYRRLDWASKGIKINGEHLNNLRFADDVMIFSETPEDLQQMIVQFRTACEPAGLSMNKMKCKIMSNGETKQIAVDGDNIDYVEEYIYLGQLVSFQDRQSKEIEHRITKAWRKYWSLKYIMKSELSIKLKKTVFNSAILPTLTYGAQTWSLTNKQGEKLSSCQRAMERSMIGVNRRDRIRNTDLRSTTGVEDVVQTAKRLKWNWAGHVSRMASERWAKRTTEWIPRDKMRRVGRPKTRWMDDISKHTSQWWRKARDRKEWEELGETFASAACSRN